ncbi:AfsR/SARP family transcriptional regulator [Sphaerisporangium sp. TRM90804]|uniref:AfsR/SARP family transcriptional regulator n=1 Tax=Sphaerisporangium sp. TRM90804 TaxID=3031113 RepID=UPI00244C74D9|nr:AfsR/SARP family transcriptional regulator [Sphaerisporangium sp. TRM90804]MDH2427321.1 AfsR/SARP family transcriptional regulator [Sphaerisporangium sp. TRM90804]
MDILPSAHKPRQIFALLALNGNNIVPVHILIEEIWGERPPRSAGTTLQTYILQLRKKLADALGEGAWRGPKDVLVTRNGGYLLNVPPGACDTDDFDRLCRRARSASDAFDAYRLFNQALALWRGPALVDVPVGRTLEREVVRLEETKMKALHERNEVGLRLGLHIELLSELASLSRHNPMNENLHAQCIVAFYRAGRTFDALETYQRLRRTMVEELGLEPSVRLRRLQQAVLTASPELEPPETRMPPARHIRRGASPRSRYS